ncbi:o-methyltransferase [Phlyctema vagabunda]|uniref:O-methyltransferase n=1 Tax=Phlyctema vagabunda TaxID=108571 RepID=A0ABR4PH38_9HELO
MVGIRISSNNLKQLPLRWARVQKRCHSSAVAHSAARPIHAPLQQQRKTSDLVELAAVITRETEKLNGYLRDRGLPTPGFDIDSPLNFPSLPADIKRARESVVQATKDLNDLVTGPEESIRYMAWDHNNSLSLHAIYHYNIAKSFPIGSTATYAEISRVVGVDEMNVRRLLRHAMTNRIFQEVAPGVVGHTAASRLIAENQQMEDWIGFCVEDMWPGAAATVKALDTYPSASEPVQTGFCFAHETVNKEPMFVTFGKSPVRAKRMGGAMKSLTGGEGYEVDYLVDNYNWESIDSLPGGGTVVDIGGSHGFVCVDLAKRWSNMKFVVQDLPKTVASAPDLGALKERITFQAHDFHTLQPVKGADVYLYRWILHNHSTPYAINMLRQLIPALKKGARIVINDHCLPEPNTQSPRDEKIMRTMDLVMLTLLNAQERTEEEFRSLFAQADSRFAFKGVTQPEGCRMSIIEAVWEGEDFAQVDGLE